MSTTALDAPSIPPSGSGRRRAKAIRNHRAAAALYCAIHGHRPHPFLDRLCDRCGHTSSTTWPPADAPSTLVEDLKAMRDLYVGTGIHARQDLARITDGNAT